MKVLVLDNYDSFTYNLVYIIRHYTNNIDVIRNDKIEPKECLQYDAIILSPGPGIPKDAGNLMPIIKECAGKIPMLGVCLGHQAIGQYLGAELKLLDQVYHGVQNELEVTESSSILFEGFDPYFKAGRYHSWVIEFKDSNSIKISSVSEDKNIMAIELEDKMLFGIQFHPESILTPNGQFIIENFLKYSKKAIS